MTLPPIPNNDFYPYKLADDQSLLQRMNDTYAQSITVNQSFWSEADLDARFRAGDQTLWNDIYGNLPAFRRRQFNFNRIRRVCNMISGYQRRNRKSSIVTPIENSDTATAGQFTKLMFWANNTSNALETLSEAFDGSITTGMNLLSVWMDYRNDPINGDLCVDNLSYNQFLIDPFMRKSDMSDCNFVWIRRYYSKQQIMSLLPQHRDYIEKIQPAGPGYKDMKFQFMPESYQYGMRNLITYDEFWYRTFRRQKMLVDTETGETLEWKGEDENLNEFRGQFPHVQVIEQEVPTTNLGIVVYDNVMYNGPNPMGIDRYPFVPVLAYYNPEIAYYPWRIQGVVRGLRDAQYLYNRRKIIELDILESQINSGWIYKEDSLVNPKDVFLSGQGRGLALKQEAQMTDVQQIIAPQVPPSMIQLSELLGKEVQEISGVNEELLGSAIDEKAGILAMLRQGAGLTTLQILFDQLDSSQKLMGKLFLELMQANFTPGKVARVIEEEPTQQFYNKNFGKYDCALEEGLNTTTQRQMQFAQLLQMREIGVPVPASLLIETSTLSNKEQLVKSIAQEEQQQAQNQQQQLQMQLELLKAQVQDLQAKAMANQGLGVERASRVEENRALAIERIAASQKDAQAGELDLIRAAKELQGMDLSQLQQLVDILASIKTQTTEQTIQATEQAVGRPGQSPMQKQSL